MALIDRAVVLQTLFTVIWLTVPLDEKTLVHTTLYDCVGWRLAYINHVATLAELITELLCDRVSYVFLTFVHTTPRLEQNLSSLNAFEVV